MLYKYNKLVRDNIINIINSKGNKANYRVLDDKEYIDELNKKLLEEANEFIEDNSVEELGDVMEVIESIMKVKNISWDDVRKEQDIKREKNGGFRDKIYLESVEEDIVKGRSK